MDNSSAISVNTFPEFRPEGATIDLNIPHEVMSVTQNTPTLLHQSVNHFSHRKPSPIHPMVWYFVYDVTIKKNK